VDGAVGVPLTLPSREKAERGMSGLEPRCDADFALLASNFQVQGAGLFSTLLR
jgi:hypothetical protein